MTLTEQQIKRANNLLDELCKNEHLNAEDVYPLFDTEKDAEYVCSILAKRDLIIAHWYEGDKIAIIVSNENTCNAVENSLLDKELMQQAKLDSKEQLETKIAMLTEINLTLQNKQLKTKMLFSIIGFVLGVIATNWKEILILLKLISPPETK